MNSDRQKVISQLSLSCMLRTSVPAGAQQHVAPTMQRTPRRCSLVVIALVSMEGQNLNTQAQRARRNTEKTA